MNIGQVEENVQKLTRSVFRDTFIYELLTAYGLPRASITRLQQGNYNLSKNDGEILWKKSSTSGQSLTKTCTVSSMLAEGMRRC